MSRMRRNAARAALALAGATAAITLTPGIALAGPGEQAPAAPAPAPPAVTPAPPSVDGQAPAPAAPIEAPTAVPAGNGGEASTTSDTTHAATIGTGIAGAALVSGSAIALVRRRIREEGSH